MKVSFLFGENILQKKDGTEKVKFKQRGVSYTVYKHTPTLLNVTGIKTLAQIKKEKMEMEKYFEKYIVKVKIDNLFFSKKNEKTLT